MSVMPSPGELKKLGHKGSQRRIFFNKYFVYLCDFVSSWLFSNLLAFP